MPNAMELVRSPQLPSALWIALQSRFLRGRLTTEVLKRAKRVCAPSQYSGQFGHNMVAKSLYIFRCIPPPPPPAARLPPPMFRK